MLFPLLSKKSKAPTEYCFYFDEDGKTDKEQKSFDYKIKYTIPLDLKMSKDN